MQGELYASSVFSTLKYTGSAITNRFYTTVANQELILFVDKTGSQKYCNSITVEADTTDIYFTPVRKMENPSTFVYTNEPVLVVLAGEKMTLVGVELMGIKLSNALGAKVLVTGTTF